MSAGTQHQVYDHSSPTTHMDEQLKNDLASLLKDIGSGEFIEGATRQVKGLVATMMEVERNQGGKPKGKVVITLSLELDRGMIDVGASVKVSEPATVVGRAMRYGTSDGLLVKEDPRQHMLALGGGREVRDATPERPR